MPHVIVERTFETPVDRAAIETTLARGGWCLGAHGVRFLGGYLSADGRRLLCVYDAPDAESVRLANEAMRAPVDRVWSAARHEPRA
jgi:hypothetical protein